MALATVPKGKLIVLRGNYTITKYFMFNPNNIADTKGVTWGTVEIPGASHPIYQFGAGGERLISFDLYIDGDRGQVAKKPKAGSYSEWQAQLPSVEGTGSQRGLDITPELMFYRSLIHPVQYGQDISNVFPSLCLFTMGTVYQNTQVIVKRADWVINYWVPNPAIPKAPLRPVRATVSIQLAESLPTSQTADDVLQLYGGLTEINFG